jgi:hypothetical protein
MVASLQHAAMDTRRDSKKEKRAYRLASKENTVQIDINDLHI